MSGEKILIIEDEKLIRMTLRERLSREGYQVLEAGRGEEGLRTLDEEEADLVLLDYKLPDTDGVEVLRRIREMGRDTAVILMTAFSTVTSAVEAIKLGAYDYLDKPVDHEALLTVMGKALETTRLRREVRRHRSQQEEAYGIGNIVGRSKEIQNVLSMVQKVASSAASTVLITGPSGTGKDLVAKAIHYASDRRDKPFMNITCTALPETLLESELFGHERGAFTDARQLKKGLLELADGGTVFLDEIGDMGLVLQAKMLRFLEEKTFRRVGGARDLRVDVRVLAATNKDLEKAVRQGGFREDLYYRLNVVPVHIPALADRIEDVPDLVQHFIVQFNREFRRNVQGVTPEAMDCLLRYRWPGNIRELKNVIERVMILGEKPWLELTDLPEELVQHADLVDEADEPRPSAPSSGNGTSLRDMERTMVTEALERADGNQSQAARLLGISRDALRYKMKKFGLL
ncbi:MAG TPA: sigma-54 dependent transcriptional regulator [Candidatus Polarisedimenticolaceae bacterium]|nr:sigma-54 dependent transcriptional regulator [Candidatus Polarisedimenticolaceae bacterium]